MARAWIWISMVLLVGGTVGFLLYRGATGRAQQESNPIEAADKADEGDDPVREQLGLLQLAVIGSDATLVEARPSAMGWTVGIDVPEVELEAGDMLEKAMKLFTEIDRTTVPIEQVTIVFRTDKLKDVYGHRLKDVVVGRLRLSGPTFHRINWSGFESHNFERLAEEWWVHEQVQKPDQGGQGAPGGEQGSGGGGGIGGGNSGVGGGM